MRLFNLIDARSHSIWAEALRSPVLTFCGLDTRVDLIVDIPVVGYSPRIYQRRRLSSYRSMSELTRRWPTLERVARQTIGCATSKNVCVRQKCKSLLTINITWSFCLSAAMPTSRVSASIIFSTIHWPHPVAFVETSWIRRRYTWLPVLVPSRGRASDRESNLSLPCTVYLLQGLRSGCGAYIHTFRRNKKEFQRYQKSAVVVHGVCISHKKYFRLT